jgi:sacsin
VGDLQLGVPAPAEVFQHLRVLTLEIAPEYPSNSDLLSDIKKTYQWLTDHNNNSELRDLLVQTHTETLFLNVDDPEQTSWIWRSADELYFNISDSPTSNCWGVRQFLMPFESLLRLAGVQEVRAPTVPDLPVSSKEVQLTLFRARFDAMRHEGALTDVRFKAEDGVEFPAHRAFLATMSDHFWDLFCGPFAESGFANATNPKTVEVHCPSNCLGWIIEYLYTEAFPPTDDINSLLYILHLAHQWQILPLNEAMQVRLIPHITMDTYEELREETKIYDAEILINKCDLFELENQDAIARFQSRDD